MSKEEFEQITLTMASLVADAYLGKDVVSSLPLMLKNIKLLNAAIDAEKEDMEYKNLLTTVAYHYYFLKDKVLASHA
ncbi:hypothetical protein [Mucilaginibacter sp. 3215]|uniref:hypothetical protein n=1 Tax=Mucilaginibacter sp. 3215 TaxID=3373912 RepID=UPI003D22881F